MAVLQDPEHALVRFDDRTYRWIDVKRFPWDGRGDDRSVLAALVGSHHYRDDYLTVDSHLADRGAVHGPYRSDAVSPGDFDDISSAEARGLVDEFCDLHQSPPVADLRGEVNSRVMARLAGASCYRLRPIEGAEHELTGILLEFRELVAISRAASEVSLIVMAID